LVRMASDRVGMPASPIGVYRVSVIAWTVTVTRAIRIDLMGVITRPVVVSRAVRIHLMRMRP